MYSPTLTKILGLGLLAPLGVAVDLSPLQIHGFVSQGYLNSSHNNYLGDTQDGSFEYNEFALNVSSQLAPDLRVGIQLFARDLGDLGNNQIEVDWAYLDWSWRQELGLRIGQVKIARGFYNEYFDLDVANPTVLLPQAVYDQRLRDLFNSLLGGGLYGTIQAGPVGSFEYQAFGGTKNFGDDNSIGAYSTAGYINATAAFDPTTNFKPGDTSLTSGYGACLIWNTPLPGLRANGSWLRNHHVLTTGTLSGSVPFPYSFQASTEMTRFTSVVAGLEYTLGDLRLAGEYTAVDVDILSETSPGSFLGLELRFGGWYGQASYRLLPRWQVTGTYGEAFSDRDNPGDPDPDSFTKDASLSLRYDPTDSWLIKVEGHYIAGTSSLLPQDNPDGVVDYMLVLALKTTVSF